MNEGHKCLAILERSTDYLLGVNSPIEFEARNPSGDWEPYLPDFDRQKIGFETDACVPFTAVESIETQINFLKQSGKLTYEYVKALDALGFFDEHGNFEASERFTAKMDGTNQNGTTMAAPWDSIRKHGLLPYKDWPYDEKVTTWAQFYEVIPQNLQNKAKEFLKYFDVAYEWIDKGSANHPIDLLRQHLQHVPLCIGTPACLPWNQVQPPTCPEVSGAHSTLVYRVASYVHILDHYAPFKKIFAQDYNIPYVMKGVVTVKPVPALQPAPVVLPPVPTNVAPTQQNADILGIIVSIYRVILSLFQRSPTPSGFASMTKSEQALVSLGIRAAAIGAISALDFIIKNLSGIGLPDPTITVPIVALVLSEADTWLVNWEGSQK